MSRDQLAINAITLGMIGLAPPAAGVLAVLASGVATAAWIASWRSTAQEAP